MLHRWFCRMCRGLPRSKPLSGRPGLRMAILLSVSGAVRAGSGRILGPTCSPLILVAQCSSTALPGNYISQPVAGLGVMSLVVGRAEEHTSELQSQSNLVSPLLPEQTLT